MLFAKIKGTRNIPAQHRILASDKESLEQFDFYVIPNIIHKFKFNPDRKLEPNEWYFIELDQDQVGTMLNPYILNEESSADLNKTVQSDYDLIEVVYKVEESRAIFTKITDGYRVKNRTILKLHDLEQVQVIQEHDSILFDGEVHAYFDGANKLYFKNFGKIRSLFPGIDQFYREATREEKLRFLSNDMFEVEDIDSIEIGQRDSARIALALNDEIIDFDNPAKKDKIIASARNYSDITKLDISDEDKISLKDSNDVKHTLNVIFSRYYISEITGLKMESYGSSAVGETVS